MSLPGNWKNWILQQLLAGQPAIKLLNTLMENGFQFEECKALLGKNLPDNVKTPFDEAFYQTLSRPRFLTDDHIQVEDFSTPQIQLYGLPDLLTASECEDIIRIAQANFQPSKISAKSGYEGFRTSTTCNLSFLSDPVVSQVESKIVQTLQLGVGENEVIQAQRYQQGQEFKQHTDYFEPGSDEYRQHASRRGQRTWTVMIYLNDDCKGGATEFLNVSRKFQPTRGYGLVWNNLLPNGVPNPDTLHQAHPVTAGEKFVITKWFRTINQ
ncbi:2OG-Fe(II) oxygenase [Paraneptunicella aestuarii]|uniref:2OG-Fe(II) oxygenase n=1 Tax=Paraneptunicella aestuarii TaxID=2831148 RepID=UPI001E654D83|nr:2OG-Fe(II) oxygenase [Paraneptunicella aestuarii]UAA38004.1 2OG-Fe(II) oxygenase [Paraneptunicella aestuarii]